MCHLNSNPLLSLSVAFIFLLNGCVHSTKKTGTFHPVLPTTCLDKMRLYSPVKSITTKTSYLGNAKTYSPIKAKNGMIKNDFNHDKYPDFLFIEKSIKDNQSRLILCISSHKKYQRRLPPFPIHTSTQSDFQNIHEQIKFNNKQLILSVFKHEHNWGGDDVISHYQYDVKRNDFILERSEKISSSGDGMRSDTHEIYDLKTLRYKSDLQCGSLEEGCQPLQKTGKVILPKIRSSLFSPSKVYTRLEPDT